MITFIAAVSKPHLAEEPIRSAINWLPTGTGYLQMGVQVDNLTAVVLFFVSWTILMIFIYSVGYQNFGSPKGDHDVAGLPPHGATITGSDGHSHRVPSVEPMYTVPSVSITGEEIPPDETAAENFVTPFPMAKPYELLWPA